MPDEHFNLMAKHILRAAISEGREGELMECLFDGGTATVDAQTRKLVLIPASAMAHLCDDDEGDETP